MPKKRTKRPRVRATIKESKNGGILMNFYERTISTVLAIISTYDPETTSLTELRTQVDSALDELGAANRQYVSIAIPDDYAKGIEEANSILEALGVTLGAYDAAAHESVVTQIGRTMELDFAKNIEALRNGINTAISNAERIQLRDVFIQTEKSRKKVIEETRQVLLDQGVSALYDRGGKTWDLDTYASMLVRTKQREAFNSGMVNRSLENGIIIFRVAYTGTRHKECAVWENKLLTPNGEFNLPTIEFATSQGLFHPNCFHRLVPDPEAQKQLENSKAA